MLTTGIDTLIGTANADSFIAYISDNANTLNSNDNLQGGAGIDTLFADIGTSAAFAITPVTTGIEVVKIRAQAITNDATNGNNTSSADAAKEMDLTEFTNLVQIDAQRTSGVNQWESNNSRSDVVIEDVRILDDQKTSDITIAFVESDPGNVDFGVYFDQHSLRNSSSGNSTLTINIMDSGAAGKPATAATPLLNNPYDLFKLGINGVLTEIQLDKTAVAAADTYEALLAVFQAALAGTSVSVALGADFTITDPLSNTQVTGKSIVITGGANGIITTPAGSGWYNTTGAAVPADSNIYTTYANAASSTVELVTSKVILDDVGRGSTGGDLVIGGLSTGDTSTSRGVERFEIEVRDNSKLQTINSTNNALHEVTIVSGVTSKTDATDGAYSTTVLNEGDLTVNGDATQAFAGGSQSGGNNQLPGVENNSEEGIHHGTGAAGFTDVRLIDASAFKGKLAFTADITEDSLTKYVNLADTQSNPAGDVAGAGNVNFNVKGANFLYTGGNDNDTMVVDMDSKTTASNTMTGQSDFTIVIDGGAGNDKITTDILESETPAAWYIDQKQNANIRIEGGEGNDTIWTKGAGDVIINAGAGNDTVYTDNTGESKSVVIINSTPVATPTDPIDNVQSAGEGAKGFMWGGKLTVTAAGANTVGGGVAAGGAAEYDNGFEVTVDIPTGANGALTQLYLNQAIKAAINNDAVLSKVLVAKDGPANTLVITSLIDGTFADGDLDIEVWSKDLTDLSSSEEAAALAAYKAYTKDSSVTDFDDVIDAVDITIGVANDVNGMINSAAEGGFRTGAASTVESDNTINLGAGNDVLVLGTSTSSNDTVVFTGYDLGVNTIINFDDSAADGTANNVDVLNLKAYLNTQRSESGSVDSTRYVQIAAAGGDVDLNEILVLSTITFNDDDTFVGLTANKLLDALNGDATFADISAIDAVDDYSATGADSVKSAGKGVVFVENNDGDGNDGYYAMFELTWDATDDDGDFDSAQLIGYADFGDTTNVVGVQSLHATPYVA